jgi:uncharacterized circularly permuted ATP-grasp superfamily protein
MDNANSELSWSDDLTGGDAFAGGFTLGMWSTVRLANNLDEAQRRIRAGREYIRQAQRELSQCKCIEVSTSLTMPRNFSLTVDSSTSSTKETATFIAGAMSEVAAKRGGNASATVYNDSTVSIQYNPLRRW